MGNSAQRRGKEYQMGAGFTDPFSVAYTIPAKNVFNAASWQHQVAINSGNIAVTAQSSGAYYTGNVTIPLSGYNAAVGPSLPATFKIDQSDLGAILLSAIVTPPSGSTLLYNPPSLSLAFGGGSAASQAIGGAATFSLQGGRVYSAPAVAVTMQFYAPVATTQTFTFTVTIHAQLTGRPGPLGNPLLSRTVP